MNNGNQDRGAIVRQEQFAGAQVTSTRETAASAMAAQVKAAEEARYMMAMHRPRDMDQVRAMLLRECARPSFAQVARYRKPIGRGIEGLSIRFVEQAMQCMGNITSCQTTVYDDDDSRIVAITVTDYERNVSHSTQITVRKTVERNKLRSGQEAIRIRTGSNGQTVYIVRATDDELLNKQGSLVSKAVRTNGLRLIPGWLQDEAEQALITTAKNRAAEDPDKEKRNLADAFQSLNVSPKDLAEYLGHDLGKVSPSELVELRAVYLAIKDSQTTWQAVIKHRREGADETSEDTSTKAAASNKASAIDEYARQATRLHEQLKGCTVERGEEILGLLATIAGEMDLPKGFVDEHVLSFKAEVAKAERDAE